MANKIALAGTICIQTQRCGLIACDVIVPLKLIIATRSELVLLFEDFLCGEESFVREVSLRRISRFSCYYCFETVRRFGTKCQG